MFSLNIISLGFSTGKHIYIFWFDKLIILKIYNYIILTNGKIYKNLTNILNKCKCILNKFKIRYDIKIQCLYTGFNVLVNILHIYMHTILFNF